MKLGSKAWLWGPILFVILFVGLVAISTTSSEVDRLWLYTPGWSRAKLVGNTSVRQPVALALDDAGTIYLFTFEDTGRAHQGHVVALNRAAEVVWNHSLEGALDEPQDPRIFWDGRSLHLLWLDDGDLYAAQVDGSGNTLAAPFLLSGGRTVGSYDIAPGPNGTTIWYGGTRREPGVYTVPLQHPTVRSTLVNAEGQQPAIQVDRQGTLHAAWVTYPPLGTQPSLYYAAYRDGAYRSGQGALVRELDLARDSTLLGPWMGLDGEQVYLFWIDLLQTVEHGYRTQAQYLSFPAGRPDLASEVKEIGIPDTDQLPYTSFPQGSLAAGERVVLAEGGYRGTVSPSELWISPSGEGELVLALRADLDYQSEPGVGQIGALFMEDGGATSYQLLTFNPKFSQAPALTSDGTGRLYATWIERKEDLSGYQIYLAGTAGDIRQALSPLTSGDIGRMVANTIFGMLTGAVFFPVAMLLWLVLPLLILTATWPLRRHSQSLTSRGSLLGIALALLAYWGVKLVTFAQARYHVPFSGWIPIIPSWLDVGLQIGVPITIALVAFAIASYTVKRIQNKSAVVFVILYALVDSFLTMAVYGGLLYNAF